MNYETDKSHASQLLLNIAQLYFDLFLKTVNENNLNQVIEWSI
jgi:hypothetical protein